MQNTSNVGDQFAPVHAAHAIEQVVFTIQVDTPLSDEQLKQAKEIARQFKNDDDMPGLSDMRGMSFMFGQFGTPPVPEMMAGFVLNRMGPSGVVEKELRVERNALSFMTTRYSRWATILSTAWRYIEAFLPIYIERSKLTGVGLNYLDKFIWGGDATTCNIQRLFREESKYLSAHVFEAEDLWHCHTGAFIRPEAHVKRLLNINVNALDENQDNASRRVITILTVLTDLLNQPGYDETTLNGQSVGAFVTDRLSTIHEASKLVLMDLLRNEMSKRISLVRE